MRSRLLAHCHAAIVRLLAAREITSYIYIYITLYILKCILHIFIYNLTLGTLIIILWLLECLEKKINLVRERSVHTLNRLILMQNIYEEVILLRQGQLMNSCNMKKLVTILESFFFYSKKFPLIPSNNSLTLRCFKRCYRLHCSFTGKSHSSVYSFKNTAQVRFLLIVK